MIGGRLSRNQMSATKTCEGETIPHPGTYQKCPQCGSRHYVRGRTIDIEYTHEPPKPVRREMLTGHMPWVFKCLDCDYEEAEF